MQQSCTAAASSSDLLAPPHCPAGMRVRATLHPIPGLETSFQIPRLQPRAIRGHKQARDLPLAKQGASARPRLEAVVCLLLLPHFTCGETEAVTGESLPQTQAPQDPEPGFPLPGCPSSTRGPTQPRVHICRDTLWSLQIHLIVWFPRVQFENKDNKESKGREMR